ncbi:MAG: DnaD domain protein [Candidatus Coproplasma sp.]
MAFISVADELKRKGTTSVENKFISKYLPELEPVAVKVYLFALYLAQAEQGNYTIEDFAIKLNIPEDKILEYFDYLSEWELIAITSRSPLEIKILDCDNYYGKPKKLHPEKFDGLYEEIQAIISERMVSQDEYREYLILLEEYGLERNALVMIINYCVNLKGTDIRFAYIKKVVKNFCDDGDVTVSKVEERLSSYTLSTTALLKIFSACSIKRSPEVEDGELYKKWQSLGFSDEAIFCAAKCFKTKSIEKLDVVLGELANNRKFDEKEIADFKKNQDSLYSNVKEIAKTLGVYISEATPYVERYYSIWVDYGYSADVLKAIASHCFTSGRNSFDLMNDFIEGLYKEAYVDDETVLKLLNDLDEDNRFIKKIHSACGFTREVKPYDRQSLARWREWGFNETMILKSAELSAGKNNPVACMNYLLAQWKNKGVYTVEQIPEDKGVTSTKKTNRNAKYSGVLEESLSAIQRAALRDSEDEDND